MLKVIDYDERQHVAYAEARAIPQATTDLWMRTFSLCAPSRRPLAVLDLGSGAGRFTPALAETFGGPVYGVEPSAKMRDAAEVVRPANVRYLHGHAENVPLPDASCDLVLMFLSFHHVRDRPHAAREIARVLRPGGRLLIGSVFSDRMPDLLWHRFFPSARAIEQRMFPRLAEVEEVFVGVGLRTVALHRVEEELASSFAETARRLRHRAVSTFEHMSETDIRAGFAAMDAAVEAELVPGPDIAESDLLVLGETPSEIAPASA